MSAGSMSVRKIIEVSVMILIDVCQKAIESVDAGVVKRSVIVHVMA